MVIGSKQVLVAGQNQRFQGGKLQRVPEGLFSSGRLGWDTK